MEKKRVFKKKQKLPLPLSHTVRRRTVRKSEVTEIPSLPRGGGDDLVQDEQVSSRRVGHVCYMLDCVGGVCMLASTHTGFFL